MAKAGTQFSKKDEWYTPIEVFQTFGPFEYDPATTKEQAEKFGVSHYDTIETDGLKSDWTKYHSIWINPPFTKKFDDGTGVGSSPAFGSCILVFGGTQDNKILRWKLYG